MFIQIAEKQIFTAENRQCLANQKQLRDFNRLTGTNGKDLHANEIFRIILDFDERTKERTFERLLDFESYNA